MKIFLGWSDVQSLAIAKALKEWLPQVIPALEISYFIDIDKVADWRSPLKVDWHKDDIQEAHIGIICLTRENCKSPWIHFAAGVLSSTKAKVFTFLFGLKPTEVPFPLSTFQYTIAENRIDVFYMVEHMNRHLEDIGQTPLKQDVLLQRFKETWREIENDLIGVGQWFVGIE